MRGARKDRRVWCCRCRCCSGEFAPMFISFSECFWFTFDGFELLYYGRTVINSSDDEDNDNDDGNGNGTIEYEWNKWLAAYTNTFFFTFAIRFATLRKSSAFAMVYDIEPLLIFAFLIWMRSVLFGWYGAGFCNRKYNAKGLMHIRNLLALYYNHSSEIAASCGRMFIQVALQFF